MEFQSMNNIYKAVHIIDRPEGYKIYLSSLGDMEYILVCLEADNIKKNACRHFIELSQRKDCGEVQEIFTDKSDICVVLREDKVKTSLDSEAEDDSLSLSEKLKFLYRLLEDMCIRNISAPFICDMLISGNIGMKSDGGAAFRFQLRNIKNYDSYDMSTLCGLLAEKTDRLIGSDNGVKVAETAEFIRSVRSDVPEDYVELFERYKKTYEAIQKKIQSGEYIGKSLMARLTRLLKKFLPVIKKVLAVFLLLAAAGVMLFSMFPKSSDSGGNIEQIGKLKIEEYKS